VSRTIRSEWTKLRTVPATAWLVLAGIACTVGLAALVTASVNLEHCESPCMEDTTALSLIGVKLGQIALVALAVLAVSGEYSTGTIRATLAANPRRWVLLASKLAVTTATALAAGVVAVGGSLLAGRFILPGSGLSSANGYATLSLGNDLTLRAAVGSVLYLGLIALLSASIAVIVRDAAASITTVVALLYLAPMLGLFLTDPQWEHRLKRFAPMEAGLTIQHTIKLDTLQVGPWAGLGTLGGYAAAAALAAGLSLQARDA
jgi:ABC-2 type transport system permease protein